jgi:DNA-binding transcriptional LysR family regulator
MELMQLEMFVAVVEERSVRRAAERVFRTQPAVSIALTKLEREIGMPLLGGHKGRELTKAGEILYECASQMLGLRDDVLSLLVREHRSFPGHLCIGASRTEDRRLLSSVIQSFTLQYPNVRVSYTYDRPENLVTALRERRIDLAFLLNQPDELLTRSVLTVASLLRFERGRSLWFVRRRSGQSHLARIFGAVLPAESDPAASTTNLEAAVSRLGQLPRLPVLTRADSSSTRWGRRKTTRQSPQQVPAHTDVPRELHLCS